MERCVDISVVIPAFDEEHRIERSLNAIVDALEQRRLRAEIIVVDDGSRDGTASVVRQISQENPTIRLLSLGVNRGKGSALRAGVAITCGARVLLTDADLSTPIADMDRLWRAMDDGNDIAIGSRAVAASEVHRAQSRLRVFAGRAGNRWIQLLAASGYSDTQCGFKLLDGNVARSLFAMCNEDRFAIDVEMIALARQLEFKVIEIGVHWEHRDGSKVRAIDYLDVFIAVVRIAFRSAKRSPFPWGEIVRQRLVALMRKS